METRPAPSTPSLILEHLVECVQGSSSEGSTAAAALGPASVWATRTEPRLGSLWGRHGPSGSVMGPWGQTGPFCGPGGSCLITGRAAVNSLTLWRDWALSQKVSIKVQIACKISGLQPS